MNIDSSTRLSLSMARLSNRFFFAVQFYVVVLQPRICRNIFGLGCSAFARHYLRNHYYFLFLRVLRCFSSPGAPRMTMDSSYDDRCSHLPSSLIRISADQCLLAAPHSFSQLTTSFIGNQCQGILPVLLFA